MKYRLIALVLSIAICLSLSTTAFAVEADNVGSVEPEIVEEAELEEKQSNPENDEESSGIVEMSDTDSDICGEDLTWSLDESGTLTIFGSGKMTDWSESSAAPWSSARDSIRSVVLEDGVTSVGAYALEDCVNLESVTLPDSLISIGFKAFSSCEKLKDVYYSGSTSDWKAISIEEQNEYLTGSVIHCSDGDIQADLSSSITNYSDEADQTDISDYTITLEYTSCTYDGTAKEPDVTVQGDSDPLVKDTDYTVAYSNNTNAGTATVTVTGIGDYTGEQQATFTITKASQSLTVSIDNSTISVGGTAQIKATGKGTITYKSGKTSVATVNSKGKVSGNKAGTAKITVTAAGDDNYNSASKALTVTVTMTGVYKGSDGNWYYYVNGVKDTSYTGFATNSSGKWYVESGKVTKKKNGVLKDTTGVLGAKNTWYYVLNSRVQTGFTGLADYSNSSGWWYITNGEVDRSVTTVAKNKNGWFYVKNGKVDRSYTGFGTNKSGSWYVKSGKVTKNVNGVYKDSSGAIGTKNTWYYVLNNKVQTAFTGLADYSNSSGWWYITNGKVDRSVTAVAKNKNGWYYVKNGKVDRSYTGFAINSSGSWYVQSGKVSKKVSGLYKDSTGAIGSKNNWYYVKNNKVQYDFSGIVENSNGWWYVKNGKVDRNTVVLVKKNGVWQAYKNGKLDTSYSGIAVNANGWWYVKNGNVDRSYTGLAKNSNGWWYVKNGKVDRSYTGTAKNSNGWWYVKNGKVDRSTVALVKVDGIWQAYQNGKLNTSYTGLAANANGLWYVKNGSLDRSYNGILILDGVWWCVENGKIDVSYNGWKTVDGTKYYISEGAIAINTEVVTGNNLYYFDSSGAVSKTIYGNKKMVALTYDDGPSKYTSTILDTLEEYNAAATFFVLGRRVESYASTIERADNMGCQIGNHTYNHTRLTTVSASTIKSEVSETNAAVKKVTGKNPTVMRPPHGTYNTTVKSSVGMPIILWSFTTDDWQTQDAASTINVVLNNVKDGDIILMHDTYSATATASQTIIPELTNRGYQLVTVEDMAMLRGGMESGVVYHSFR